VAHIKMELVTPFITATEHAFRTLLNQRVRRTRVYRKQGFGMHGEYTGMVGLTGATTGTCAISLPSAVARRAAAGLLHRDDPDSLPESDVRETVGALIDTIAGGAKSILAGTKHPFNTTLPTIISGGSHEMFHRPGTSCVVVLLADGTDETFALDVAVKPE